MQVSFGTGKIGKAGADMGTEYRQIENVKAARIDAAVVGQRGSYRARQAAKFAAAVALSVTLVAGMVPVASAYADDSTSASQSQQQGSASDGGTPPDMPSGSGEGSSDGGTPPDMPDGEAPGGDGQAPDGGGQGGPGGGANTQSFDYSGSYTGALTADGEEVSSDGESYEATDSDQNAALAENGGTLTVTDGTFTKSGDDTNGDNCNFYGLNSILLSVGEGSTAYVSDTSLSATSEGSNGIFATDSGTVYANNDTISTTAGNSRGLDATYGGTIVANQMTIETEGDHCAALATDRGGGYISATNSSLSTAGSGSPLLYSTGDIEVDNVTGTATGSQIAGMEGLNTIMISNSELTSTQTDKTASDPVADGIIIYQSTSGDAETSTGEAALFQAVDSTLSSAITSGSMFYLTNTTANIVLSNTELDFDSDAADLLLASGNDSNNWGSAGSNGATVNFTAIDEELSGDIEADTISTADVYLLEDTTWEGTANILENSSATNAADDNITMNVDGTSTWIVTGDSTVTNLNVADGGKVVDSNGDQATIVDANGNTLVEGSFDVTVTVTGSYSTTVATSDANEVQDANIDRTAFDDYYGTSTSFGANSGTATGSSASGSSGSSSASSSSSSASGGNVLDQIAAWFKSIFGWE